MDSLMRQEGDHWHDIPGISAANILGFGIIGGKLRVKFSTKGAPSVYQYETDQNLCCAWAKEESIGTYFHRNVRNLPTTKIR